MVNRFNELLQCKICFELYSNPHILSCGHVFCSFCCYRLKNGDDLRCPVCLQKSPVQDLRIDYHTVALVEVYLQNNNQESIALSEHENTKGESLSTMSHHSNDIQSSESNQSVENQSDFEAKYHEQKPKIQLQFLKKSMLYMLLWQMFVIAFIYWLLGEKLFSSWQIKGFGLSTLSVEQQNFNEKSMGSQLSSELLESIDKLDELKSSELRILDDMVKDAVNSLKNQEMQLHEQIVLHHEGLWNNLKSEKEHYKEMIENLYLAELGKLESAKTDGQYYNMLAGVNEIQSLHADEDSISLSDEFQADVTPGKNISQSDLPKLKYSEGSIDEFTYSFRFEHLSSFLCYIVVSFCEVLFWFTFPMIVLYLMLNFRVDWRILTTSDEAKVHQNPWMKYPLFVILIYTIVQLEPMRLFYLANWFGFWNQQSVNEAV